jgi:CO/xanthine dehydrogenase FAD-binding subunit
MRVPTETLTLQRPASLEEALRLLRQDGSLVPLAGGTDLYVQFNAGRTSATRFLDIWPLDALRGIGVVGNVLRLGALNTYSEIIASPTARDWLPMLVDAARQVGSVQIHNRGTLGGNLGNASPAGDTLPVWAAADAVVVLRSLDGERRVPFLDFQCGYRATTRRADELVAAVEVPRQDGTQWFRKVGARAAQTISKVVMAAVRGATPRVALGSVAPVVVRARRTEALLAAGAPMADAQAMLRSEIAPIDDIRSTAAYRAEVACRWLARFWHDTAPE